MSKPAKKRGKEKKENKDMNNVVPLENPSEKDKKVIALAEHLLKVEEKKSKALSEANDSVKAAKAHFKDVVEKSRSDDPMEVQIKLEKVEMSWQDWEEEQSRRVEVRKAFSEQMSETIAALRKAIEDRKQYDLFEE